MNNTNNVKTKKPKEIYKRIMDTKLCDFEHRTVLFEYLRMSMKEHYNTIFGDINDDDMVFVFDEDASLMIRVYVEQDTYEFNVKDIFDKIPLNRVKQLCFETFIDEMYC